MPKVVQKLNRMSSSRVVRVGRHEFLQKLDLVECCFRVVAIRFDDFERDVLVDPVYTAADTMAHPLHQLASLQPW